MIEYPKLLFRGGQEITVQSASEEAARIAEGFVDPNALKADPEPVAVVDEAPDVAAAEAPASEDEGPTFGAAHEPHRDPPRRGRKKR